LAAIDQAVARLRDTMRAISTNLVDLETDPGRTRLDQAALTGTTAMRWSEARGSLAWLWQWFAELNTLLEKAGQLRGPKPRVDPDSLAQLDWLVNGPSIELSTSGVPLAQRGLFGAAETTIRCSPPQLLDKMRAAFEQVVAVIDACSQRWATLEGRLTPLDLRLAEVQRLADGLGEANRPELDRARSELEELRQSVFRDPLEASVGGADGLAATLDSVGADLRRLAELRDNLGVQLNEAQDLMAALRTTTEAAGNARAEALAGVAHPAVVDPPAVAGDLDGGLVRVTQTAARGDWRAAANLLTQWTTRCRDALSAAERALAANRAPVAARHELRGRLDAYRAKAYRLGLLEDARVAGLYAQAKGVLYTAPTDLTEAEQLVLRYQQALTGPAPREVAT